MQSKLKTILYYHTALGVFIAAFFLPLLTPLSNVGLFIFVATTVFSFVLYGADKRLLQSKILYLTMPLSLIVPLLIPGLLISSGFSEAFEEITKYLFLLIVPIALFRKDIKRAEMLKMSSYGLVMGSIISATVLLYNNTTAFLTSNLPLVKLFSSHYTNFNFTAYFSEMHPIYLGTYYLMALVLLIKRPMWKSRFLKIIAFCLIFCAIFFLNSRIIYGLTGLILMLTLAKSFQWKALLGISIGLFLIFFIAHPFISKTYIYNKAINATVWDLSKNVGTHNTDTETTSDSRFSRWLVGWEAFTKKPILGYGTGMEKDALVEMYNMNRMEVSLNRKYNSHNQYLSYLIRFGVVGGMFIFGYIIVNSYVALRRQDDVCFYYVIIIGIVFLVENYIDRNMGINFVAIFGTVFLFSTFPQKSKEEKL